MIDLARCANDSELADLVHDELRRLAREARASEAAAGELLLLAEERALYVELGMASVAELASRTWDLSADKTRTLLRIERELVRLPALREAYRSGELSYTRVRELVRIATPADEQAWVDLGRSAPSAGHVRLAVNNELARRGERQEAKTRLSLEVSMTQLARVEELRRALVQEKGRSVSLSEVVDEAFRRALTGGEGGAGGSTFRVVLARCPDCERASQRTRHGEVPVPTDEIERTLCDCEVQDGHDPTRPMTRTVPAAVAREVDARAQNVCEVPSCGNTAFLEYHHLDGWREGHDPKRIPKLCWTHHVASHEGKLRIEGRAPDLRFFRSNGVEILEPKLVVPEPEPVTGPDQQTREDALGALVVGLGFKKREAKAKLERVLRTTSFESPPGAGDLVRAVLVAEP